MTQPQRQKLLAASAVPWEPSTTTSCRMLLVGGGGGGGERGGGLGGLRREGVDTHDTLVV